PRARNCLARANQLVRNPDLVRKFLDSLPGRSGPARVALPDSLSNLKIESPLPRLSVCLIVKNEEKFLPQCLESIRDIAEQIVVVDTGSTDRTIEMAKKFGAEVYDFPWVDDFSAARNAALEHARVDWVLTMDA